MLKSAQTKEASYLIREKGISKGTTILADLVGRPRDKDANIILVKKITDIKPPIVSGGIARLDPSTKKVVVSVDSLKVELDSGSQVIEGTYELGQKLGVYAENISKTQGPVTVKTNTGSYGTFGVTLTISFDSEDLKKFGLDPRYSQSDYPEIYRSVTVFFPDRDYGNKQNWDVLLGLEGWEAFSITLEAMRQ